MQRAMIGVSLCFVAGMVHAQATGSCTAAATPGLPVQPTLLTPLSPELATPAHQLGAPTGALSQAFDETLAVDNVLLRRRLESCQAVANATPAATPALPASGDPAAYKPQTKFDNTPWRFDMSQNGKRMTADEFSAWMKARGVRVAKGAQPAATTPPAAPTPTQAPTEAPTPEKKK